MSPWPLPEWSPEVVDTLLGKPGPRSTGVRQTAHDALAAVRCWHFTWTYVIAAAVPDSPVKIGITDNLAARLADIQACSPFPLMVIALAGGDLEKDLHAKYAQRRLHGEWFAPSVGDELRQLRASGKPGDCLRCIIKGAQCPPPRLHIPEDV